MIKTSHFTHNEQPQLNLNSIRISMNGTKAGKETPYLNFGFLVFFCVKLAYNKSDIFL